MKAIKRIVGKEYPRKTLNFRGCEFYTRTLGGVDDFSKQYVYFATGWTFDGHDGVCSDLMYAITNKLKLDENDEMGLWMKDKFKSKEQMEQSERLKSEIREAGGDPDCRGG